MNAVLTVNFKNELVRVDEWIGIPRHEVAQEFRRRTESDVGIGFGFIKTKTSSALSVQFFSSPIFRIYSKKYIQIFQKINDKKYRKNDNSHPISNHPKLENSRKL